MINNNDFPIKVFVFGTLRKGGRLDYYMSGSEYAGKYYAEGQLMKSEIGSAYIDFTKKNVATIGELYYMDFPGLQRIDHLESNSREFPKGYDLDITPIWIFMEGEKKYDINEAEYAFVYKRRNEPKEIICGDWIERCKPVNEIKHFLERNKDVKNKSESLIKYMFQYLNK